MRKKDFTSFDVVAVVRELKDSILNARINNVYQLDAKTLLLKLHKPDCPALRLIMEAGKRMNLTAYALEKPLVPPAFCMALRKYLRNAWLTSIEQYEFERVVILSFKSQASTLKLILEFFGDGNAILTDDNDKILQALTYKRMRDRNIIRGEPFKFAPSSGKNPSKVSKEEFSEGLKTYGDVEVVRAVARYLSMGGVYAEEVLLRTEIDKTTQSDLLTKGETEAIFDCLQDLLSQVRNGQLEPNLVSDKEGGIVDVVPLKLKRYEDMQLQSYASFNEALDEFYIKVRAFEQTAVVAEVDELRNEADRLRRIIVEQETVQSDAEIKAEQNRKIGDTIYAHFNELQTLIDRFLAEKQDGKESETTVSRVLDEKLKGITPSVFFESFDGRSFSLNVNVDNSEFGLDLRKTLFDNSAGFYELSKRAKQKLAGAKTSLNESRKSLEEIETKMHEAEALRLLKPTEAMEEIQRHKVKHKEWFEKFRWFVSSDGFLVVAGKDAVTNEVLIKKHTEPDDVIFHADIVGAPFVVIKTMGKKPSDQCLLEAGEFAASFSRGWREGYASVDVYRVRPEQLSKGGPSGQSVAHGAFAVRGERNWFRGVPLRVSIGVNVQDSNVRFVGGPISAVKAKTQMYTAIVPGETSGKELYGQILRTLSAKLPKEQRESASKASFEDFREYVPYGKGKILDCQVT